MICFVMGLPGAGKTTFLTWCVLRALKDKPLTAGRFSFKRPIGEERHYKRVFSNIPIDGTYQLNFDMLGKYEFNDSLIVIDEAGSLCDSRNWKEFGTELRDFVNMHRHYHCDFIICSQSFDIDKKIRDRVAQVFYLEKMGSFTAIRPVKKDWDFTSQPTECYEKAPPIATTFLFRWLYYSAFDSFEAPELPKNPAPLWADIIKVRKYVPRHKQAAQAVMRALRASGARIRRGLAYLKGKLYDRRRNETTESVDSEYASQD